MRLNKLLDREQIESEIDEELQFHLELLTQEHLQKEMSLLAARDAAVKRFGNVGQIKDQCVEITRRRQPLMRALQAFLIPVFLGGVLVRVFSTEINLLHMGDLLIFVAILGRLLLHLRGSNSLRFRGQQEASSPLMLLDRSETPIATYDQRKLTPIERVISN